MNFRQSDFTSALLDPEAAVPGGLINPDGEHATKRFDVYRNNVAAGLSDALETAFPVVRKLVGDAFFRAMAGVYLRKHPPKTPVMMFYGDAMPAFLRRFPPARSIGYLADIAAVELALRSAYHAADATPAPPQALSELPPEALMQVRLRLAPAVHCVVSDYPIHAIYLANTVAGSPKPVMRPEAILITRHGFDPDLHLIDAAAAGCIAALKSGQTLGQAMTAADQTPDIGHVLGLLLAQGAITDIY